MRSIMPRVTLTVRKSKSCLISKCHLALGSIFCFYCIRFYHSPCGSGSTLWIVKSRSSTPPCKITTPESITVDYSARQSHKSYLVQSVNGGFCAAWLSLQELSINSVLHSVFFILSLSTTMVSRDEPINGSLIDFSGNHWRKQWVLCERSDWHRSVHGKNFLMLYQTCHLSM